MNLDATATLLAGRYQLVRKLGGGSTADVHAAFDTVLGASVGLKCFREQSPGALRGLKAEFRMLADIHHPNLVKLFDLVVTEEVAFFTMELVNGVTFAEYARTAPVADLRRAIGQLSDAIAALHEHGTLHRDVKPANVLVTSAGDVRVLDFGLASARAVPPMAGTLAYMAPELFAGEAAAEPGDWYGFGVLLYEAVTGRLPADGPSVGELVLRKSTRRFPRASELARDLAPDLDELVWALLDPDPRTRADHASVASVVAGGALSAAVPVAADGRFFGRHPELVQLAGALDSADAGRTNSILVEGPSGIGKTALVRAFLETAQAGRCTVLRGAARPQELVAFRAFDAVIDDMAAVIESLPDETRRAVVANLSPSLARSFPVLVSLPGVVVDRAAPGLEALEARREAQGALGRILRALSSLAPLIVWIDDIQWSDYESLVYVRSLLELQGARILFVLTRRPGPLAWADHEQWLMSAERITLGPLDEEDARKLLRARASDPAIATRTIDEAGGNAFLIEFFARHVTAVDAALGTLDLGSAVRGALLDLSPDARGLFECIALAQRPLPMSWLGGLVQDRTRLRDQVASLSSGRLVSVDAQERVRPYHDALRERAEGLLLADTRVSRHGSVADILREHNAPPEWQVPHLEGAGRLEAAGEACLRAADTASDTHAFEIAVQLFQKALRLAKFAPRERARTLERLSDNLALMGRGREAAMRYEEAVKTADPADDPQAVLAIEHKRALALLRTGALEEGRAVLRSVLRGVGERLPESTASALGTFFVERSRLAIERRWTKPAAQSPIDGATQLRLDALWTAASGLSMYQPLFSNALIARFVRQALRSAEPRRVVRALTMEAVYLAALGGRYRRNADALDRDLRTRFELLPWPYERGWVAASIGTTAWLSGDVRECCDWTCRARGIFMNVPETGAFELALLDAWRLPALALVGDFEAATAAADDTLAVALERNDQFAPLPCLHGYMTNAYLACGQVDLAVRRAEEGRRRAQQLDSPLPALHQNWSWTTLALHAGDGARAYENVRNAWGGLRRSGALMFESAVGDMRDLRGRAAVAAAAKAAPRRLRTALLDDAVAQARWLKSSTLRAAPAMGLSIEAQVARLHGRDREAQELASRAERGFGALGMAPPRDAMGRWARGSPAHSADSIFVVR
jgi:hypothetical protein